MSTGKIIVGVLAGIAAGAALGLLIAPDSGKNIRRKITSRGEDYFADLKDQLSDLVHKFSGSFADVEEGIATYGNKAKSKARDFKADLENKSEEVFNSHA